MNATRPIAVVAAFLLLAAITAKADDPLITVPQNTTGSQLGQQELMHLLKARLPGRPQATIDKAASDFLRHLQETSPIIAENFSAGHLGTDELASRLEIFLSSHEEFLGKPVEEKVVDPRSRISELLKAAPDVARSAEDRQRLVEQFLQQLGSLSGSAKEDLLAGRMSMDDLQTRVSVFISDARANASKVAEDPSAVAAGPVVESYIKANFGTASERMDSICYRGTVDDTKNKHDFTAFKMRPNLFRLHVVRDGIVYAILAFDGTQAWVQGIGRPAVSAVGKDAEQIQLSAEFDDPLIGYRERGAVVRLLEHQGGAPYQVSIREKDGTEALVSIDSKTYIQTSIRRKRSDGHVYETRFDDYRTVGTTKIAFRSEEWTDGVLHATTRYTDVKVDAGLIPSFFSKPGTVSFGFMDMMGGLAIIESRSKNESFGTKAKATP